MPRAELMKLLGELAKLPLHVQYNRGISLWTLHARSLLRTGAHEAALAAFERAAEISVSSHGLCRNNGPYQPLWWVRAYGGGGMRLYSRCGAEVGD
jgi:hypothetical protein